jgi:predicted O-methyltransferase YrrM
MNKQRSHFYHYTIDNFDKYLSKYAKKENIKFLQIGAYAGDASLWLSENILTGSNSELHDVDIWDQEHLFWGFESFEKTYDDKVSKCNNIIKHKMKSDDFFKNNKMFFDFIYVDGGIEEDETYNDIVNSFKFLKDDGIIIVDNYTNLVNNSVFPGTRRKDYLRFINENNLQKIYFNSQAIIEKTKN